jgi:hypothetical protein
MPIVMAMRWDGLTANHYDAVMRELDFEDEPANGGIVHVSCVTDAGLRVLDVWESEDALKRFFEERLGEALGAAGIDAKRSPPKILPVHNMLYGSGTEANVAMIVEVPDLGTETYDEMTSKMEPHRGDGSNHPCVTHTAAAMENGGVLVVDLWDSPESFGEFAAEQIGPAGEKVGLGPIEPRFVPVHNRIRGRAAQRA